METIAKKTNFRYLLSDIALDISWAKIAQRYFGKSSSWIYHKLDGIDGNGGSGEFTYAERLQLRNALFDFSERIRKAAQSIEV